MVIELEGNVNNVPISQITITSSILLRQVHSVNRELVERGLAAWYEGVEEAVVEYPPEEAYLVPAS